MVPIRGMQGVFKGVKRTLELRDGGSCISRWAQIQVLNVKARKAM